MYIDGALSAIFYSFRSDTIYGIIKHNIEDFLDLST